MNHLACKPFRLISALICVVLALWANPARAGNLFWDNNGTGNATSGTWDLTTTNWAPSSTLTSSTMAFTNGATAIFTAGPAVSNMTITVTTPITIAALEDNGVSGNRVTNLTINASGSGVLTLSGDATTTNQMYQNSSATVTINCPINGGGLLSQNGAGSLQLYGTNSYSGGTLVTGGQILYYNNANSFGAGPVYFTATGSLLSGSGSVVTLPNDWYISTSGVVNFGSGNTTCSGNFYLQATPQLKNNGGSSTVLTISGPISELGGSQGISLQCNNGGKIVFSGPNTYTGRTRIGYAAAGATTTLSVSSINSVSSPAQQPSSSLGVPADATAGTIDMGSNTYAGALIYTGSGETSDRVINLLGTTGGGIIEMDGTGPLVFTSDFTATGTGAKTLTLQGSSTATNTIQGAIPDSTGGKLSLTKAQAGTWVLSGANTYSGATTITNAGTLSVNAIADSGGLSGIGYGSVTLSGGTLAYTGAGDTTTRTFNGTSGTTSTIDVPASVTLTLNGAMTGSAKWTVTKTGAGTLVVGGTANNSYFGMNVNAGTVILNKTGPTGNALGSTTVVNAGGTLQLANNGYGAEIYNGSTTPLTVANGGLFDLNGQNNTIYSLSLSGSGISGSGALINSASGTISTLTCPITLAAATTIGGSTSAGDITLPGAIGGSLMSLTYAGMGTLTLGVANTYSGGTTVNAGTLNANASSSIPGNVTVNGGVLNANAANSIPGSVTINGGLVDAKVAGSIAGNVTVTGTGGLELDDPAAMSQTATLTLPASPAANSINLTFSGTQSLSGLVIGSTPQPSGTYGVGANNPNNAFTGSGFINVTQTYWDANGTDAASQSSANGGGNGVWDNSTGDWWVSGSSDVAWAAGNVAFFAGTAGTVTVNDNVAVIGLTFTTPGYTLNNTNGTSALTLGGPTPTISVPAGTPTTISCNLAGGGSAVGLTASGPGMLILSGTNTYTGGTAISGGASVSVNAIADSGTSSLGLPLTLGTVGGPGASLLAFTGASGLTTNNVTLNGTNTTTLNVPSGNTLELDGQVKIGSDSAAPALAFTGGGTLILGGITNDNAGLTMSIQRGKVIINKTTYASAHGLGGGASSVGTGAAGNSAQLQLSGSGGYDLYSGCIITVNGVDGLLDLNGQSDTMSTLTLSGAGPSGTGALINNATGTTSSLTNGGSGVVLAGNATIGGSGNIILNSKVSGGYSLTYAGTGTLTLTNANTYSGGTIVNSGGTVQIVNQAAAGTGTISLNGTATLLANIGNVTASTPLSNTVAGGSSSIINFPLSTGNMWLLDDLSGFTGTINVTAGASGTPQLVVGNSTTYTTAINAGATWNIQPNGWVDFNGSQVNPARVNLYGQPISTGSWGALRLDASTQSGDVVLYGSSSIGNGNASPSTVSGVIRESGGSYGFTKMGTAANQILILTATNTYSGPTTNSAGVLTIGGAGQLGSGNYAANIVNNATFNYNSSAAQTLSGVVSGTGLLMQSGPGTLALSGVNTYTGGTLITNGSTLAISGAGSWGNGAYAGNITNYGVLLHASSTPQTLSGVISGTGGVTQSGSGMLTLSGVNTYTGGTTVSGGTLALAIPGSINTSAAINLAAGATFDVSAYALSYALSGSTTLNAKGAGTGVGTTAATIKGGSSGVVTLGSVALTFTPQTFTGDAAHPALYVSQGALNLIGSGIAVTNAAATPLGTGTYSLIQVAGGSITTATTNVTVFGTGLAPGTAASLAVSGGSLNLVVTTAVVPRPFINSVSLSGANLIFSGTNGPTSGNFYVLSSTNVQLPLSEWTTNASGSFSPTGTFIVTNAVGSEPMRFFILEIP